jgi:hypothetical protein
MKISDSSELQLGGSNEGKKKFSAVAFWGNCGRGFGGGSRE